MNVKRVVLILAAVSIAVIADHLIKGLTVSPPIVLCLGSSPCAGLAPVINLTYSVSLWAAVAAWGGAISLLAIAVWCDLNTVFHPTGAYLIVAGAAGNLWDRLLLVGVRDPFFVSLKTNVLFAFFNISDVMLSVGLIALIIEMVVICIPHKKPPASLNFIDENFNLVSQAGNLTEWTS